MNFAVGSLNSQDLSVYSRYDFQLMNTQCAFFILRGNADLFKRRKRFLCDRNIEKKNNLIAFAGRQLNSFQNKYKFLHLIRMPSTFGRRRIERKIPLKNGQKKRRNGIRFLCCVSSVIWHIAHSFERQTKKKHSFTSIHLPPSKLAI